VEQCRDCGSRNPLRVSSAGQVVLAEDVESSELLDGFGFRHAATKSGSCDFAERRLVIRADSQVSSGAYEWFTYTPSEGVL
jgi:hypothetical protein